MSETTRERATEVLMLLVDNDCTSASASGLEHRQQNRKQAMTILCGLLGIQSDDMTDMYMDWCDNRERVTE